ncbi:MAG: cytochrome c oxidase assembly protein [Ilumatobacteraceae bacterium]
MPDTLVTGVGIPLALVAAAAAYGWAVIRLERDGRLVLPLRATTSFVAGLIVVALALLGPVDARAHDLFAWHMVQHLLLVSVASPLLAIGQPITVTRAVLGRHDGRAPRAAGLVGVALVQVGVLMAWHIPWLYEEALTHDPLHGLEHVTLLGTAFFLWSHLLRSAGAWRGVALIVLFLAAFPPMAYGVGLTLATTSWYSSYTLDDQQIAGVLMWAYGGAAVVVGGVGLFANWLVTAEAEP